MYCIHGAYNFKNMQTDLWIIDRAISSGTKNVVLGRKRIRPVDCCFQILACFCLRENFKHSIEQTHTVNYHGFLNVNPKYSDFVSKIICQMEMW